MTLLEMITEVRDVAGGADTDIVSRLNRVMLRCARDLALPRHHLDVNNVYGEFTLDVDSVGVNVTEVLSAYRDDKVGTPMPLLSTLEANRRYPGWKNYEPGTTQFLIYEPAAVGLGRATIRPVPTPRLEVPESYVVAVVSKPAVLDAKTDEPFDGLLPEYHEMLVKWVIYELLLIAGDKRYEIFRAEYEALKRDAYNYARPFTGVVRNAIYGKAWS